jgi:hypothetical protein
MILRRSVCFVVPNAFQSTSNNAPGFVSIHASKCGARASPRAARSALPAHPAFCSLPVYAAKRRGCSPAMSRARTVQSGSCFRVRPHGFFPDPAFGREQSNSTGGTRTRVAPSFTGAHPNSEAETANLRSSPLNPRTLGGRRPEVFCSGVVAAKPLPSAPMSGSKSFSGLRLLDV